MVFHNMHDDDEDASDVLNACNVDIKNLRINLIKFNIINCINT